jgi:hypothetical protein
VKRVLLARVAVPETPIVTAWRASGWSCLSYASRLNRPPSRDNQ